MEKRYYNYASILYEEHFTGNFTFLNDLHVPFCVSPLHTEEDKKPHYHVLFCFESLKSQKQVSELLSNTCLINPIGVVSKCMYARYLCHLDENPLEKNIYSPSEVYAYGLNYYDLIASETDDVSFITDILAIITVHQFTCCRDLFCYLLSKNDKELLLFCKKNIYLIRSLMI